MKQIFFLSNEIRLLDTGIRSSGCGLTAPKCGKIASAVVNSSGNLLHLVDSDSLNAMTFLIMGSENSWLQLKHLKISNFMIVGIIAKLQYLSMISLDFWQNHGEHSARL